MQYVGQICRTLQKRFGEHYRRITKPKIIDTFHYQHFKRTGHSPIVLQLNQWRKLHMILFLPLDSKTSNDLKLNLNG